MSRPLLTALACLGGMAALTTPLTAQTVTGVVARPAPGFGLDLGRIDARRARRAIIIGNGYGYADGNWAYANNRSFEPNSYNDWWHERPARSLPRWVTQNQSCERLYWSGAGWRC